MRELLDVLLLLDCIELLEAIELLATRLLETVSLFDVDDLPLPLPQAVIAAQAITLNTHLHCFIAFSLINKISIKIPKDSRELGGMQQCKFGVAS
jgi:hypothetical protein